MANRASYEKYKVNPEAEILGSVLLILTASQNLYNFVDLVEKYGYNKVDPEGWYSLQEGLTFLKELTERHSDWENMVSIGMKLLEVAPLPPEITTIEGGLQTFNMINKHMQRNVMPNRDFYIVQKIDDDTIHFTDLGPYPHDLVYGEVYSVAQRLSPKGARFTLTREYLNAEVPDADGAVYHIRLER